MFVLVDLRGEHPAVSLEEASDCSRLHVLVRAKPGEDARSNATALSRVLEATVTGWVDGDGDAFVRVDALERLAGDKVGESWTADVRFMIDYAASRGWASNDLEALQAHVIWE